METNQPNISFRVEKVADYLEALIDPFDLDVFTPHLHSNLNRLVQRTSVSPGATARCEGGAAGSQYSRARPSP